MNWTKKGLIFTPQAQQPWMLHHSQVPTVLVKKDHLRVFFTTRHIPNGDRLFVSNMGYVDLDLNNPSRILALSEKPVLELGSPGTFDEFGIMPGSVIRVQDKVYLYYTGWTRGQGVPYMTSVGLAISDDDGETFHKAGLGPVMSRTLNEPYLENGPYALFADGQYHMWYASGTKWLQGNDRMEPVYVTMHATSNDGIHWNRNGKPCLTEVISNESNGRPTVLHHNGTYHMWFCYRASTDYRGKENGYRMGYATSKDLKTWTRNDDQVGITLSDSGWDSEMQAYPQVISLNEKLILFYNGNAFGKHGFGFAEMPLSSLQK